MNSVVLQAASQSSKPRFITTPKGYKLKWTKPSDPTADDWARLKEWDDAQPVNPDLVPGASLGAATGLQKRKPLTQRVMAPYTGPKVSDEQQASSDAKMESDYLFNVSNDELGKMIEDTYKDKRPSMVSGRSIPEIREKLLTERQRRLGQAGDYALPPGIRQLVALGLNFPEQLRASAANIGHPESSVGDTIAGTADIAPLPFVEDALHGLGKIGSAIIQKMRGRKFADTQAVEKFLNTQGLTRDQVTMVMRKADAGSVATAPKLGVPEGANAGLGRNIKNAVPDIEKPFRPKAPNATVKLDKGVDELAQERLGREAANIRAANPNMPEEEVQRLARQYAQKPLAAPKAKPVSEPTSTPKPAPVTSETPKTTVPESAPELPKPEATGVANQVQDREAVAGIINQVEPAKGKSPEQWHSEATKHTEGWSDDEFVALARGLATGNESANGLNFAALQIGKQRLLNAKNEALRALDKATGVERHQAFANLKAAESRLQSYVEDVQEGAKGPWSDMGRAFQIGVELDTGNFAQVLEHAPGLKAGSRQYESLKEASGKVAEADAKIAEQAKVVRQAQAESIIHRSPKGKTFDRITIEGNIDRIRERLLQVRNQGAGRGMGPKTRGAVAKITAEDLAKIPEQAKLIGMLAIEHAKLGAASLEELITAVKGTLLKQGIDADRQAIIDAVAGQAKTKTRTQAEKEYASLRRQLKEASTQRNAEKIASTKAAIEQLRTEIETGNFRVPGKLEKKASAELQKLIDEKNFYAGEVQKAIHSHNRPLYEKVATELTGAVRGLTLGGDVGVMTRQGLFSVGDPRTAVSSTIAGLKAAVSEKGASKVLTDIRNKRIDGQLMGPVRREAGLSLTDNLSIHEEMTVLRWIRQSGQFIGKGIERIPGAGKPISRIIEAGTGGLERFQLAWINHARATAFDRSYKLGMRGNELKLRAEFINNATGRGNFKQTPGLLSNVLLTSPRYEKSRWAMLYEPVKNTAVFGKDLAKGKINKGAAQNMTTMVLTAGEVYGMMKLAEMQGYSVNFTDPSKPDWLKLRRGNEVWDVSAGIAPRLRDLVMAYGIIADKPGYRNNARDIIGKATTRTISPAVRGPLSTVSIANQRRNDVQESELKDWVTGMKLSEQEKQIWRLYIPLIINTATQAQQEEGDASMWGAALKEFVGGSVNRYPDKVTK